MRKTFVIAFRDYLAAVKTKSFLISLALMPLIVAGGSVIGRWSQSVVDTSEKRIAVIDRTAFDQVSTATQPATVPGTPTTPTTPTTEGGGIDLGGLLDSTSGGPDLRPLYQVLTEAAQERDEAIRDEETGKLKQAPYTIEPVTLNDPTAKELAAERLKLSDRVRKGELFAFIEIGPSIISSSPEAYTEYQRKAKAAAESLEAFDDENDDGIPDISDLPQEVLELQDQTAIRYSSKSTTNPEVQGWIKAVLTDVIQRRRLSGLKVPEDKVLSLVRPLEINQRALAIETDDGAIGYEPAPNPVAGLLVPFFSVFLLFSLIATAAFPLTTNIIEEKQLRIAEVLLGSVRPFELMLGKLLGGVAISLTLAVIYGAGLFLVASQFSVLDFVGVDTILWFAVFASLATLMVGALSVAAGAAVTNLKEAQNIQTPIVLLPMAPAMVAFNVAQNPQGPLAYLFTWFPVMTPITSVMRITIRDSMPTTERFLAAGFSIVTTLALIWLAGRIFRHGMLKSEKAAGMKEMVRWVTRG